MKKFLRENPTVAFGLGLPLLLVVAFLLVSGIPALLVAPPQYDVLYATEYYNYQNGVQISVIDQKVKLVYQSNAPGSQKPHIWRFNPKTGAVKEVAYLFPPSLISSEKNSTTLEEEKITLINVPDLEAVAIDSSSIAPDGYEFSLGGDRYSRNVFDGLFYSSRYSHDAVLTKSGRSIQLPHAVGQYYRGNTHFIGWVVSP